MSEGQSNFALPGSTPSFYFLLLQVLGLLGEKTRQPSSAKPGGNHHRRASSRQHLRVSLRIRRQVTVGAGSPPARVVKSTRWAVPTPAPAALTGCISCDRELGEIEQHSLPGVTVPVRWGRKRQWPWAPRCSPSLREAAPPGRTQEGPGGQAATCRSPQLDPAHLTHATQVFRPLARDSKPVGRQAACSLPEAATRAPGSPGSAAQDDISPRLSEGLRCPGMQEGPRGGGRPGS